MHGRRAKTAKLAGLAVVASLLCCHPLPAQEVSPAGTSSSDQEIERRVESLLSQMTLEEKVGQMTQNFVLGPSQPLEPYVAEGKIGSLLFVTDPALINHLQHIAVEQSRLHIPLIFGFDVIHGFRTMFPVPLALAASWDPTLATSVQTVAAKEASAVGIHWAFAPMVDIARDPRWGRIVEGAGEDPYLGSAIAAAQVRGFQGEALGAPDHVLASVKHFGGYGGAEGGRDYDGAYISSTQLHNVYLPPYEAAVKAGAGSVMSAYMDLNDVPATANHYLLTDVLRKDWGFRGFVVSDSNAVKDLVNHGFAENPADAAIRAVNAGVDMEMSIGSGAYADAMEPAIKAGKVMAAQVAPLTTPNAFASLVASVKSGKISIHAIDEANRNILRVKFQLGLFDHPYVDEARAKTILAATEHRALARVAAERSAVLLRNEGNLLPLSPGGAKRIAVLGPLADSQIDTLGSWAFQENLGETITVLDGLRSKLGSSVQVDYAPAVQISRIIKSPFEALSPKQHDAPWSAEQASAEMAKALALAKVSDLNVLVLGENQDMSGESASRESLSLPGEQEQLLEAVTAIGKPVVLVLLNGRPLDITWASKHVPAILEAWYPGTQGGAAVANLLYGSTVPGGKLPVTWPRTSGQIPLYYAHNTTQSPENQNKRYWDGDSTPLYPFGYGLSYSTFAFTNLKVDREAIRPSQTLSVSVDVENTGSLAADTVAQLYIHQRFGRTSRPVRELKGFERTALAPHEKKTIHFALGSHELSYWSAESNGWIEEPSVFDLWVGDSSEASLHTTFAVTK